MQNFKNKVAVITGAASGIGRALAEYAAKQGMKLVLADIQADALAQTERYFVDQGATVLAVQTDVAKAEAIEQLAQNTLAAFGEVHLLFNNAGVAASKRIWEHSIADWEWVMGANVWSVIHGIRTFVPIMLKQNTECHIVNTASIAGLISGSGLGAYKVSKHAVVTLSETLFCDLADLNSKIGVSVLCPGWVQTQIWDSGRNRAITQPEAVKQQRPGLSAGMNVIKQLIQTGIPASEIAQRVFEAIEQQQFYILTHPNMMPLIDQRFDAIRNGGVPAQSRL